MEPSNAVLEERLNSVIGNLEKSERKASESRALIFDQLRTISEQTTRTNGRVTRAEGDISEQKESIKALQDHATKNTYLKGRLSTVFWIAGVITAGTIGHLLTKIF